MSQNVVNEPTTAPYLMAAESLRGNSEQWAAYQSRGHCVIQAGPGSGKTKTLTIKMARMLAEDVHYPRGVACITFNTECARELERRLDQLGIGKQANVFIGTLHTFCLKHILIPYAHLVGLSLPQPLRVASDKERQATLQKALDRQMSTNENPVAWESKVNFYRRTYLDRHSIKWAQTDGDLVRLITTYEDILHTNGLIDFDDMMLYALQLLEEHSWIGSLLQARFPILVVDEYQDLGSALHRIVLALALRAGVRVLAVGDPDQSIYGFAGAQPELLNDLADKLGVSPITLALNYRSGKAIVQASSAALGEERSYLAAPNADDGMIKFHGRPLGLEEQIQYICSDLLPAVRARREGRNLGDMAILYIDKNDGDVISKVVSQVGLPYIRIDRNAPYHKTPFTRWLEDCAKWCSGGWQQGQPQLSTLIQTWLTFNQTLSTDAQRLTLRRDLVSFLWSNRHPDALLIDWLEAFTAACLQVAWQQQIDQYDNQDMRNRIIRACASDGQLRGYTVTRFARQGGAPDHLNLITLHSAKGLEFDVVFMPGLEEGRLPRSGKKIAREQRRLFYVGLTRARYEVHLLCSGWWKDWTGNRNQNGPSSFLLELHKKLNPPQPAHQQPE